MCWWSYLNRIYRINKWDKRKYRVHSNESQENDISRNLYCQNEAPIYEPDKMNAIRVSFLINTVITHTASNFLLALLAYMESAATHLRDIQ